MNALLRDLVPCKAQFQPDDMVELEVVFAQPAPAGLELAYTISALAVVAQSGRVEVPPGMDGYILRFPPLQADFCGYGVQVEAWCDGQPAGVLWTAFDTVADYRKAPRYGFLSDFFGPRGSDSADNRCLLQLHINLVQYYDWMYRHEQLIPDTDRYTDIMGKPSELAVVREKIERGHKAGMRAMAYGAIYAASEPFYQAHPGWNLAYPNGDPITFIDRLFYMDISTGAPWRQHILEQFQTTLTALGFDGVHMDTYGYPKTAHRWQNGALQPVNLAGQFPSLIDENARNLKAIQPGACIIFNNVGNWPVDATAGAPVDAVYVEVWDPYSRYAHIREIIRNAARAGGGKPVILAAYLKPFRTCGAQDEGAQYACLYLTSAIFAHGAGHLLLGEERGALTQGYYAEYAVLSETFFARLRRYYDFAVRYLAVLYDPQLEDVSSTHAHGDNTEYCFSGARFSADGSPGTVWAVIRESTAQKVISLINLTGCAHDRWNEPHGAPEEGLAYALDIQLPSAPISVFRACPERDGGSAQPLEYAIEHTSRGMRLRTTIAQAGIFELVVIQLK